MVAHQASLYITISQSLPKFMFIEQEMLCGNLILYHSLLLLPSIFPSVRVFSNKSALRIRWPKYWSFSFSISPSSEYSELISFRIDRFNVLAVQGTLKNLLQHHSWKASIRWCSAFFMVQFSHPSMTTGKTNSLAAELKKAKFNIHNPRGLVPPPVQLYAAGYRGTMWWVGRLPFGMEPISRNPLFQVFPSWSSCLCVLLLFKVLHIY